MSKENKKEELNTSLIKAINDLNEMRGNVKAFILLASTDEPSKEKTDAVHGINAVGGKMNDLVELFYNIDPDITHAATMLTLGCSLAKAFKDKK